MLPALVGLVLLAGSALSAPIAIRFGTLITGKGDLRNNAVVVVDGDRIRSVQSTVPEGAQVIDLSNYTGIPGMIDAHVHITYALDRTSTIRPFAQGARHSGVTVFLSQENARKTLESGVTTVRNLGTSDGSDFALRELIDKGYVIGPRIFTSGCGLSITRSALRPGVAQGPCEVNGPAEVMRAARQQIGAGAEWIKMFGSTGSGNDVSGEQTFTFEEMKAAVDVAHALGRRVAIHSYGPRGARDAVRAGADTLEHATGLDDETIAEMVRRKTFYVPTIDHNRYYAEHAREFGYTDGDVSNLNAFIEQNLATARRAFSAGVRFAMGSDAVFSMFGENTRELEFLVKAGMTPRQALDTATVNGAAMLGREAELGAVAPGYFADLVAVAGDPTDQITAVTRGVKWVMKGGKVVVDKR